MTARYRPPLLALVVLLGCRGSLSPLSNRLAIGGEEAYVVFAADGEGGAGDLFASTTAGGTPWQVTFTRLDERLPALSPDGTMLAFLRVPDDEHARWLVVMNLLNGEERRVAVPGAVPDAIAWARNRGRLYLKTGGEVRTTPAPPSAMELEPLRPDLKAEADSALTILLGDPPVAEVVPCTGAGVCVRLGQGAPEALAPDASQPLAWSGDSIAYLERDAWVVRPLAGGRTRVLAWTRNPHGVRNLTLFPGRGPQ